MASPLLFLLASLSLAFLCTCEANLISMICSRAVNRPLCTQVLKSDPRARGADLRDLGLIIIQKAEFAVNDAIMIVYSITDRKAKNIVETCERTGNNAIDDLYACSKLIKRINVLGIKGKIQAAGAAAMTNVGKCGVEFGDYKEPDYVKAAYRKAHDLINILLVIINTM